MSDPHQIDKDLRDYLEKEPNLRRDDRILYLKSIFEKYFTTNKLDHMVNRDDLYDVFSSAGNKFSTQKTPMFVSGKLMDQAELKNIAVIESFVSYLNKMNLLKKSVKLDYTG